MTGLGIASVDTVLRQMQPSSHQHVMCCAGSLQETAGGDLILAHAFCYCELPTMLILVSDTALDLEPLTTASDLLIVERRDNPH